MVKDAYYFPHDSNAMHDPKLAALIKDFGFTGYGLYWAIVEIMHEQGGKIEKFPKLYEGLSQELRSTEAELKRLISASINDFHLFKEDDNYLWSERVLRNKQDLQDKRTQKVDAGRLGGIASGVSRSITKQNEAPLEANEQKESKVKESKVNKRKNMLFDFESLWLKYPNKAGKSKAQSYFTNTVKTEEDWRDIQVCLDIYITHLKNNEWKKPQDGKTWFNSWKDWRNFEEPTTGNNSPKLREMEELTNE